MLGPPDGHRGAVRSPWKPRDTFPSRRNTGQAHTSERWGRRWSDADIARASMLCDVILPPKSARCAKSQHWE